MRADARQDKARQGRTGRGRGSRADKRGKKGNKDEKLGREIEGDYPMQLASASRKKCTRAVIDNTDMDEAAPGGSRIKRRGRTKVRCLRWRGK